MKRQSIASKINLIILPVMLIAMMTLTGISYYCAKDMQEVQIAARMESEMGKASEIVDQLFVANAKVSITLAKTVESSYGFLTKENYKTILDRVPLANGDTFGAGVWFEPYRFAEDIKYFGPYAYKDQGQVVYTDDYCSPEYDYLSQEWYTNGKDLSKEAVWSLPYYDPVAKITMITATAPMADSKGELLGATTADMDLTTLQKEIGSLGIGKTGKVFMVDANGLYVVSEDPAKVMQLKIQEEPDSSLAAVGAMMIGQESGQTTYREGSMVYHVYFKTVPGSNMIIGAKISEAELNEPLMTLLKQLALMTGIFILSVAFISAIFVHRKIRPLKQVVGILDRISQGDLTAEIPGGYLKMNDEVGAVAASVHEMQQSLQVLLADMKETSCAIESHSEELNAISVQVMKNAREVSESMGGIATGTHGQAEDLVNITGIISDFGNAIDAMVEKIVEIDYSSKGIEHLANEGNEKMHDLIHSIEQVSGISQSFGEKISGFTNSIARVNQITALINGIADQTNLLALNAAIEAARAGETGRGFAVVADEIRKLAEQSKHSSETIQRLIDDISATMESVVQLSSVMGNEIRGQVQGVDTAISAYDAIVSELKHVIPMIESIHDATSQINSEKNVIAEKIESISAVAEEISASTLTVETSSEAMNGSAHTIAGAADSFESMTQEMSERISRFKLTC